MISGENRRKNIIQLLRTSTAPLSGSELGKQLSVSRQVVVQDIALLRSQGQPIVSTARGYTLDTPSEAVRVLKVCHTNEQVADELQIIVDHGGVAIDVFVNHKIYGKLHAPLNIKSRRDIQNFVKDMQNGRSTPLLNVTNGYHFHTISAESQEILDEIEQALDAKGYLMPPASYEQELVET